MTNREKLEKDIECMNKKGGKSADEWNMFFINRNSRFVSNNSR